MSGSEQLRGVRSSAVGLGRSSDKTRCVHLCDAFEERRWKHSAQSRILQFSCSWAFACGLLSLPPTPVHSAVTEDAERRDIVWVLGGIDVSTPQQRTFPTACDGSGFSTLHPLPCCPHPGKGRLQESIRHVHWQGVRGAVRENHHPHPTGQGCG